MNWNRWIRQAHRWISMLFVLIVAAIFAAMAFGEPPQWVFMVPLLPLALLVISGVYLFILPYAGRRRHIERQGA